MVNLRAAILCAVAGGARALSSAGRLPPLAADKQLKTIFENNKKWVAESVANDPEYFARQAKGQASAAGAVLGQGLQALGEEQGAKRPEGQEEPVKTHEVAAHQQGITHGAGNHQKRHEGWAF